MLNVKGKLSSMDSVWGHHNKVVTNPNTKNNEVIVASFLEQPDKQTTYVKYQLVSGEWFYADELGIRF